MKIQPNLTEENKTEKIQNPKKTWIEPELENLSIATGPFFIRVRETYFYTHS